jgi:hypothetical protein
MTVKTKQSSATHRRKRASYKRSSADHCDPTLTPRQMLHGMACDPRIPAYVRVQCLKTLLLHPEESEQPKRQDKAAAKREAIHERTLQIIRGGR